MPNVRAIKNGLWSDTTVWNTGSLPSQVDDVFANNFTVTADNFFHVNSIRNVRFTPDSIAAGGTFVLSGAPGTNYFALTAYVYGGGVTEVPCLRFASSSRTGHPTDDDINIHACLFGSLCAGDPNNRVARPLALRHDSQGNFYIFGNLDGVNNNDTQLNFNDTNNAAIVNLTGGNLTIVGYVTGDTQVSGTIRRLNAISNRSTGNIFLSGGIRGGGSQQCYGIYNHSTGNIFVTGFVFGGAAAAAHGIVNNTTGRILLTAGDNRVVGSFFGVNASGINNTLGEVSMIGTVSGGNSTFAYGIQNRSGVVSLTGYTIGNTGRGLSNNNNTSNLSGFINVIGNVGSNGVDNNADNISRGNIYVRGNVIGPGESIRTASDGAVRILGDVFYNSRRSGADGGLIFNNGGFLSVSGNVIAGGFVIGGVEQSGLRVQDGLTEVIGNVFGGGVAPGYGIFATSNARIFIRGNVFAGRGSTCNGIGLSNDSGTVTVSGNVFGSFDAHGITIGNNCTVVVNGTAKGGGGTGCHGVNCTGTNSRIYVRVAEGNGFGIFSSGDVPDRALGSSLGVNATPTSVLLGIESLKCGIRGNFPVAGSVFLTAFETNFGEYFQFRKQDGSTTTFLQAQEFINYVPAERDVRYLTPYGGVFPFNRYTGTLRMPTSDQVIFGVPVDNSTGTGFLCATEAWATPVSSLVTRGSMGVLSKGCLTINSLSAMIISFNS